MGVGENSQHWDIGNNGTTGMICMFLKYLELFFQNTISNTLKYENYLRCSIVPGVPMMTTFPYLQMRQNHKKLLSLFIHNLFIYLFILVTPTQYLTRVK